MTTTTTRRPATTSAPAIAPAVAPAVAPATAPAPTLAEAVAAASASVADLDADDPRWSQVGPILTAFVDAARRAEGLPGSPIRPDEAVAPVLRLRDLARLAERSHRHGHRIAPAGTLRRLRSLQVAVVR